MPLKDEKEKKGFSKKRKQPPYLWLAGAARNFPPAQTHRHGSQRPWEAVFASWQQEPQVTQRKQTKTTAAQAPGQRSLDSCTVQPQGALVTLTSSCLAHPCLLSSGGPRTPRRDKPLNLIPFSGASSACFSWEDLWLLSARQWLLAVRVPTPPSTPPLRGGPGAHNYM